MSKHNKKYSSIGEGEDCPKCSKPMERREHKSITDKLLRQPFYFSECDYCKDCWHLQHYEYKKVWNKNKPTAKIDLFSGIDEYNNGIDFVNNLN